MKKIAKILSFWSVSSCSALLCMNIMTKAKIMQIFFNLNRNMIWSDPIGLTLTYTISCERITHSQKQHDQSIYSFIIA